MRMKGFVKKMMIAIHVGSIEHPLNAD